MNEWVIDWLIDLLLVCVCRCWESRPVKWRGILVTWNFLPCSLRACRTTLVTVASRTAWLSGLFLESSVWTLSTDSSVSLSRLGGGGSCNTDVDWYVRLLRCRTIFRRSNLTMSRGSETSWKSTWMLVEDILNIYCNSKTVHTYGVCAVLIAFSWNSF